jgi:small subunit ribosomal protein S16
MVRLRLRKVGSKAQQAFRIVAAEHEHPRDGRFLENLGFYNPRTEPATIDMDEARIYQWLKNGAQPSESVQRLFRVAGTMARFERFKGGEAAEALSAEAKAAAALRHTSVKTSGAAAGNRLSKKKKAAEKKAAEAPAA